LILTERLLSLTDRVAACWIHRAASYLPDLRATCKTSNATASGSSPPQSSRPGPGLTRLYPMTKIDRIRHLIRRIEEHLDKLTENERAQIQEAVTVIRRTRPAVSLGMPTIRPRS